jgi:transcription antitermination factor NusG
VTELLLLRGTECVALPRPTGRIGDTLDTAMQKRPREGESGMEPGVDGDRSGRMEEAMRWYACYTRSRHEKKVDTRLAEAGFETHLPLVPLEREWHDRTSVVEMPLFPGYLFARFSPPRVAEVIGTPGLVTVVSFGGRYAPVSDEEVDNVRRIAAAVAETGTTPDRVSLPEVGERVRITDGPFQGVEAVVMEHRRDDRLLVAGSQTLGQGVKLELDRSSLELLD